MSKRGSDVEKRLSVLELELKSLQNQPASESRFQEMVKLIRVYETKLLDLMNEKTKLERYSESLEQQICELVDMTADVRDVRYILRNQRSLEETKAQLEKQIQDYKELQAREQRETEDLRSKFQADYYKEMQALRSQFVSEANTMQSRWEQQFRELDNSEKLLRSQSEQLRLATTERVREVLKSLLKPILTISLCKSKEGS